MANTLDDLEAFEHARMVKLDRMIAMPTLYRSGDSDPTMPPDRFVEWNALPKGARPLFEMGDDPRLPPMPARPTLIDYFKRRFNGIEHVLQSARLARINGCDEKTVLACLLHDISMLGFIGSDHGYWGAQLIAPYVDEEVSWAVRYHQALRFFADPEAGYEYPQAYIEFFGEDYVPDDYIKRDYEYARNHKWYMSARTITVNDVYAFDPDVRVDLREFEDIIARHFRQPEEGLGNDGSPSAHMWRTMIRPRKFL